MPLAATPQPPYYAVIFSSVLAPDADGYAAMAEIMYDLAKAQDGYLGHDSVRNNDGIGITVSYWRDKEAILAWRDHSRHQIARKLGRERWFDDYSLRVAHVERASTRADDRLRKQRTV